MTRTVARCARPLAEAWQAVNALQIALALATVAGFAWLGLIALAAYLQIPELPLPRAWDVPVPTGLLVGGIALGLIVSYLAARAASVGASRRSRAVRRRAEAAVGSVAEELVIAPIQAELDARHELRRLLTTAQGRR